MLNSGGPLMLRGIRNDLRIISITRSHVSLFTIVHSGKKKKKKNETEKEKCCKPINIHSCRDKEHISNQNTLKGNLHNVSSYRNNSFLSEKHDNEKTNTRKHIKVYKYDSLNS
ncbi:hypothetical protein POVCU2_0017520, partial [Plasmodium ovale curtisi]